MPSKKPTSPKQVDRAKVKAQKNRRKGVKARKSSKAAKRPQPADSQAGSSVPELTNGRYERSLAELQTEMVRLQEWVRYKGLKLVVIFEGRDASGKGGVIKRMTYRLNPRHYRVVALSVPSERETTQWYFQRYVTHLPAAGEIVFFDRSWYNRAGVERVMGYCSEHEYQEFLRSCPAFERMLVRSGIQLIKYWFSVSKEEQDRRFRARLKDPAKRWKLSEVDIASRQKWREYSQAKDDMFAHTDIKQAPWYVVKADSKKRARLNCMHHLLSQIPYENLTSEDLELPPLQDGNGYVRPPVDEQSFVPDAY